MKQNAVKRGRLGKLKALGLPFAGTLAMVALVAATPSDSPVNPDDSVVGEHWSNVVSVGQKMDDAFNGSAGMWTVGVLLILAVWCMLHFHVKSSVEEWFVRFWRNRAGRRNLDRVVG